MFSTRSFVSLFVCPFVSYRIYEHDILKMNKPISMQIGASGLWVQGMKGSTSGVGQRSVTHSAELVGLS